MNDNETPQSLTSEEIEQAKPYWNEIMRDSSFLIFCTIGLEIFLLYMSSNSSRTAPIWGFFIFPIASMFGCFNYFQAHSDKEQSSKQYTKGVFKESGTPANRFTTFVVQRINGKKLIFPPKIYYQLAKGDMIEVYYTNILHIVVSCKKLQNS